MSAPYANVELLKGNKMFEDVMCVYCQGVFADGTVICSECDEYDGMMPLQQAIRYLDLDPNDYL